MPFLPTLGAKDATTARAIGRSTRVPSTASQLGGYDIAKAVEDGFDRVVWPFRCADAIGLNQSKLRMVVREGDDPFEGEEVEDHPLLPLLNGQSNPYETATAFRYRLSCQFLVSNRGVFVERVDNRMGDPLELHLLPPHQTKPIPPSDPRNAQGLRAFIDHFEVRIGGKANPDRLDPEDVVWIRKPHPLDPYRSLTPLEQAGLAVDVAFWSKVFIRNYLGNDGRGAAILAFKGQVDDADIDELDARMNAGPGRAGRTSIIDQAEGMEHVDLSSTPGEWYSQTGDDVRDECLVAFGTPLTVLGQAAERTFANADAETDVFWRETMLGHLRFVSTAMDPLLGGQRGSRVIGWDLSQVAVLQRDKRERDESALQEFQAGAINLDTYNEMVGREPVGGKLGQTYWLPMARVPFIPGEREPSSRGGSRGEEEPGEEPGEPPEPPGEATHGGLGVKQADDDEIDDPWFEVREAAGARFDRWERAVHDVAVRWFERVGEIVVARLTGKQGRRGTRHWTPTPEDVKQIDPDRVFPRSRFSDEFVDDMTETLERLYDEVGGDVAETLDATFNRTDPAVAESITTRSNRLSGVVDETWERVADAIAAGEQAGESIDAIADRVRDEFSFASRVRARTIARTEVVSAANDASLQAARQSGGVMAKMWLTSRDPRVRGNDPGDRFSHVAMDGVKVPVGERFSVSGELLDYPGDPAGSGGNVINCRCTLVYERGV